MKVETKSGSATDVMPDDAGIIIAHLANCVGAWGAGFVVAINKISLAPKLAYKEFCKNCTLQNCPAFHTQTLS